MTHSTADAPSRFHWSQIFSRVIVPLWLLTGALFKLYEADAKLLPKEILSYVTLHNFNLDFLLAVIISVEFLFAATMFFIKPLARTAAITILIIFCGILINEIAHGTKNCGCMGGHSPSPIVMLCIDGALLLLTTFIRPRYADPCLTSGPVIAAALFSFAGVVLAFAIMGKHMWAEPISQTQPAATLPVENPTSTQPAPQLDSSINPAPKPLPSNVIVLDDQVALHEWVGKNYRDLEIFQYMPKWPTGLDTGRHYVIFFSRTCEHCQAMFNRDLIHPQSAPVHAIEIPADRNVLTDPNAWPMPANSCEILGLPLGPNYIISPPVTLTIENGIVTCATPHDYRKCLSLPPLSEDQL